MALSPLHPPMLSQTCCGWLQWPRLMRHRQGTNSLALVSFKALGHQKAMSIALMQRDWAHWKGESQ